MLSPKQVVCRWVDAFNSGDAEAVAGLYHEDAVNHQVANAPVEGVEAIRRMFREEFAAAEMVCIVENIFEDGQWAVLEWRDPLGLRWSMAKFSSGGGTGTNSRFCGSTACRWSERRDRGSAILHARRVD